MTRQALEAPLDAGAGFGRRLSLGRTLARSGRARALLVVAAAGLLPLFVFGKALVGRALLAPGDAFQYYLPMHMLAADAWRAGDIPGWNPFSFAGSPLLATGQAGAFYPFHALFLFLPALYANNLVVLLNLAVATAGAAALARKLTGDDAGAVVAGLAFGSSGFVFGHLAHQSIEASIAWMPWALLGYERLRARGGLSSVLLTGGALAMAALAGQPQMFFTTVVVLVVYAVLTEALSTRSRVRGLGKAALVVAGVAAVQAAIPRSTSVTFGFLALDALLVIVASAILLRRALHCRLRRVVARVPRPVRLLALALVVAFGLGAVQLLPALSVLDETSRGDYIFAAATTYSFSPSHLPLLLFPYLFGNQFPTAPFDAAYHGDWNLTELAGYPGLACLVLAAAGLARSRRDPRAVALTAAAALMLLVALGASTGLGVLVWLLPPFGHFRAWARYVVVADLAVAVLAAYGVAELRRCGSAARRAACRRAAIAAGALVGAGVVLPLVPTVARHVPDAGAAAAAVAIPLLAALAAAGACLLFGRRTRLALAICIVVVPLDGLASFGAFFEWRHAPSVAEARAAYSPERPAPWGRVPDRPGGIDRYLFVGRSVVPVAPFLPPLTDVKGLRSASGYDPLAPARYLEEVGAMETSGEMGRPGQFLRRRSPLLDLLRVSLVLVPAREAPARAPEWLEPDGTAGGLRRYRYSPRVGDAFLVDRSVVASPAATSAYLDARRPVVGSVEDERWSAGRIAMDVDARRPSLLVVSQSWFPGWSARVDSTDVPAKRVDGLLTGVHVPAGSHHVELAYRVPGLPLGVGISIATLLGCGIALAAARGLRRRTATRRSR